MNFGKSKQSCNLREAAVLITYGSVQAGTLSSSMMEQQHLLR